MQVLTPKAFVSELTFRYWSTSGTQILADTRWCQVHLTAACWDIFTSGSPPSLRFCPLRTLLPSPPIAHSLSHLCVCFAYSVCLYCTVCLLIRFLVYVSISPSWTFPFSLVYLSVCPYVVYKSFKHPSAISVWGFLPTSVIVCICTHFFLFLSLCVCSFSVKVVASHNYHLRVMRIICCRFMGSFCSLSLCTPVYTCVQRRFAGCCLSYKLGLKHQLTIFLHHREAGADSFVFFAWVLQVIMWPKRSALIL